MAVRRISDLPMLSAYYPDAQLSDCMMEVSYAKPNTEYQRIYQSFSANVQDAMLCAMRTAKIPVDALPRATKDEYGVVKIGDNINVNDGVVSIADASETTKGLIKEPPDCINSGNKVAFLQYSDHKWSIDEVDPTTMQVTTYIPAILEYQIIDLTYPVGSLFISTLSSALPPGISSGTPITTSTLELTANVRSGYNNISERTSYTAIKWNKLPSYASLWNVALNDARMGNYIAGELPKIEIEESGEHYHKIAKSFASVEGSGHHANKTVLYNFSSTTSSGTAKNMNDSGKHTHTLKASNTSSAYKRTDNAVIPTSYCVNIWKRTQ